MRKTFREAYPILSKVFYHTIIELITRPGYMIRDYLRGHQVIYLGPVSTLLVALSCVTLCTHIYEKYQPPKAPQKEIVQVQPDSQGSTKKELYNKWGKCNFGKQPLTAGAHYQTLVYLYAIFTLLPLSIPLMIFYLVWTYRGIYGMKWLKTIKYVSFTACWTALYLAVLLAVVILTILALAYIFVHLFYNT